MDRARGDQGFSLIELAVVLIIVGVLVSIAIPTYLRLSDSSHDAEAKSEVRIAAETAVVVLAEDPTVPDLGVAMSLYSPSIAFDPVAMDGVRLDRAADNSACIWRVSESNTVWAIWMSFNAGEILYGQLGTIATCPTEVGAPGAGFVSGW